MDNDHTHQFEELERDIKTDFQKARRVTQLKQEIEEALRLPLSAWVANSEQGGSLGKDTLDKLHTLQKFLGADDEEVKQLDQRIKGRSLQVRGVRIEQDTYPKQNDQESDQSHALDSLPTGSESGDPPNNFSYSDESLGHKTMHEPLITLLSKGYFWNIFSVLIVTGFLPFFILSLPFAERTQLFILFLGMYPVCALLIMAIGRINAMGYRKWQPGLFFLWGSGITVYLILVNTIALGFAQITLLRTPPLSSAYNPLPFYDSLILPIVVIGMVVGFLAAFIEKQ